MSYSIQIQDSNISFNCEIGDLRMEFINLKTNKVKFTWTLLNGGSREFCLLNEGIDRIHVVYNQYDFRVFDIIDDNIIENHNWIQPDFSLPFICLTGAGGGGTSIVAKSLKYLGIHFGDDCGQFANRKTFESMSMRTFIDKILVEQDTPIRNAYGRALAFYNYRPNEINAFKITDLENKTHWANGVGLSKLFKDIKFVAIVKESNGIGISPEGKRFNQQDELTKYKNQHPKVQAPIFHLNWHKYFSDHVYFNEVLEFIGSDIRLIKSDFEQMLDAINFDRSLIV